MNGDSLGALAHREDLEGFLACRAVGGRPSPPTASHAESEATVLALSLTFSNLLAAARIH